MGLKIFLSYLVVSGFLGMANCLYMAGFLLSTESIYSPKPFVRYWYRYCVFSFCYLLSTILSLALYGPLLNPFERIYGQIPRWAMPISFLPIAMLLYWANCRISAWADGRKLRARESLRHPKR